MAGVRLLNQMLGIGSPFFDKMVEYNSGGPLWTKMGPKMLQKGPKGRGRRHIDPWGGVFLTDRRTKIQIRPLISYFGCIENPCKPIFKHRTNPMVKRTAPGSGRYRVRFLLYVF